MKKTLLLFVSLVSLFAVQVSAVDLSYNFKVGSSYAQSTKTTFTMGMNVAGQTLDIGTAVGSHLTYTVRSVKDTCYEIDVRYDSISISMSGITGNQTLNSSVSAAQGKLSDVLKQFLNKPFQITLSKKGKVMDVRNYEALFSAFDAAGQTGQDSTAEIGTQLKQNFSKEAFLSNVENYMSFFPAKSIKKGDSWTSTNNMVTSGLPVELVTSYTLKDVTNTEYIIFGYSMLNTDKSSGIPMSLQGMTATIDLQGGVMYDIVVDRKTGWLKQMTGKIDMDATVNMSGDQLQGQKLTMKIKGNIESNDR